MSTETCIGQCEWIQDVCFCNACACFFHLLSSSSLSPRRLTHSLSPFSHPVWCTVGNCLSQTGVKLNFLSVSLRSIVDQLQRCQCAGLPLSELPEEYRVCLAAPLPEHRKGVCIKWRVDWCRTNEPPAVCKGWRMWGEMTKGAERQVVKKRWWLLRQKYGAVTPSAPHERADMNYNDIPHLSCFYLKTVMREQQRKMEL